MEMEKSLKKSVSRRDFLKRSGKAALAVGGALTLEKLLYSCAPALKETSQDVDRIEWECNPMIPIPDGRCYTGTNAQMPIDVYKDWWEESFGISPTFNTPCSGPYDASNDVFPKEKCEAEIRNGVIPVVRYVVRHPHFDGFKCIAEGKLDEDVKKFAHQAAKFEHPMVLIPFEQPNSTEHKRWIHSGYPGKE
ncbi:MAG: twin-arginine translocation signal domain-containing protein, partial [Deltaproteobacteria bacterium]